jgi:hypothetical protein
VTLKINEPFWKWLEKPANEYRLKRFSAAMTGAPRLDPPNAIDLGFKWGDLLPDSVVVDVGGDLGHITMKLLQYHPNLKYIVQDRVPIIDQAHEVQVNSNLLVLWLSNAGLQQVWQKNLPSAVSDGSVSLQGLCTIMAGELYPC